MKKQKTVNNRNSRVNIKQKSIRKTTQNVAAVFFTFLMIIGLIKPIVGLTVMVMMISFLILSIFKGRLWCGYLCPRGSFLEQWFTVISRHKTIPGFFKKRSVKQAGLGIMMSVFVLQLIMAWGDLNQLGAVFIRMCLVTSIIAFILGFLYKPRTWCAFCPMGFLQGIIDRRKSSIKIHSSCSECSVCSRVCPIQTKPDQYKQIGRLDSTECIKCKQCVAACPKNALSVPKSKNAA